MVAVHCASAELINDDELVAVTGDRNLLTAWRGLGLTTYDTTKRDRTTTADRCGLCTDIEARTNGPCGAGQRL